MDADPLTGDLNAAENCIREADVLVKTADNPALAADLYEAALRLRLRVFGASHPSLLPVVEGLACASNQAASADLHTDGQLENAKDRLSRTMALLSEVQSCAQQASIAQWLNLTLCNLASLCERLGNRDLALVCLHEAETFCTWLPAPDSVATQLGLSALLSKLGQHQEAEQHAAEAARLAEADILALREPPARRQKLTSADLTDKVASLAVAYNNLAVQQEMMGRADEGLLSYEKAVILAQCPAEQLSGTGGSASITASSFNSSIALQRLASRLRASHRDALHTANEMKDVGLLPASGTTRKSRSSRSSRAQPGQCRRQRKAKSGAHFVAAKSAAGANHGRTSAHPPTLANKEFLTPLRLAEHERGMSQEKDVHSDDLVGLQSTTECRPAELPPHQACEIHIGQPELRSLSEELSHLLRPVASSPSASPSMRRASEAAAVKHEQSTCSSIAEARERPTVQLQRRRPSQHSDQFDLQQLDSLLESLEAPIALPDRTPERKTQAAALRQSPSSSSGPQRALFTARRQAAAIRIQTAYRRHRARAMHSRATQGGANAAVMREAEGEADACTPEPEAEWLLDTTMAPSTTYMSSEDTPWRSRGARFSHNLSETLAWTDAEGAAPSLSLPTLGGDTKAGTQTLSSNASLASRSFEASKGADSSVSGGRGLARREPLSTSLAQRSMQRFGTACSAPSLSLPSLKSHLVSSAGRGIRCPEKPRQDAERAVQAPPAEETRCVAPSQPERALQVPSAEENRCVAPSHAEAMVIIAQSCQQPQSVGASFNEEVQAAQESDDEDFAQMRKSAKADSLRLVHKQDPLSAAVRLPEKEATRESDPAALQTLLRYGLGWHAQRHISQLCLQRRRATEKIQRHWRGMRRRQNQRCSALILQSVYTVAFLALQRTAEQSIPPPVEASTPTRESMSEKRASRLWSVVEAFAEASEESEAEQEMQSQESEERCAAAEESEIEQDVHSQNSEGSADAELSVDQSVDEPGLNTPSSDASDEEDSLDQPAAEPDPNTSDCAAGSVLSVEQADPAPPREVSTCASAATLSVDNLTAEPSLQACKRDLTAASSMVQIAAELDLNTSSCAAGAVHSSDQTSPEPGVKASSRLAGAHTDMSETSHSIAWRCSQCGFYNEISPETCVLCEGVREGSETPAGSPGLAQCDVDATSRAALDAIARLRRGRAALMM